MCYPWLFNKDYIKLYRENYSDCNHKQTLEVIDNSFAIGDISAAPSYLMNDEIIDLYIKGFEKINKNINKIIEYCNLSNEYISPYLKIPKLSDTKGMFIL